MYKEKFVLFFLVIFAIATNFSQTTEKKLIAKIYSCNTNTCKVTSAFTLSEYYLETDEIPNAQKWLDSCKIWNYEKISELPPSDIFSLQSELFYYFGLFQFGIAEANKGIEIAQQKKDSIALADLYFFRGINHFEMRKYENAEMDLHIAKNVYPSSIPKNHLRTFILSEHIFNNLGQLKLQLKQWDSAHYYNIKAYQLAKIENSGRALANCEQTFGLIQLGKKNADSAIFYFKKSKETALKYKYYDIATLAEGYLMKAHFPQKDAVINHFKSGENVLLQYPVNTLFRRLFYKEAAHVFDSLQMPIQTIQLQAKLLQIEDSIRMQGNTLVQDISQQYIETERELFNVQRNEFEKQKKLNLFQFIVLLLVIFSLVVVLLLFRRKNNEQRKLLQQKTEISNDLHDDIGSGLTSILIHAQLLEKNPILSSEQKKNATKISETGAEISQRLNTFIWTLNEANDTLQGFLEYVKTYTSKTLEGTDIVFQYFQDVPHTYEIALSGQLRKNLFFCIKELITNILKHSQATQVTLQITCSEKRYLQIIIEDNGIGVERENKLGNGLLNIEKRIKLHKGEFQYTSINGCKSIMKVPL